VRSQPEGGPIFSNGTQWNRLREPCGEGKELSTEWDLCKDCLTQVVRLDSLKDFARSSIGALVQDILHSSCIPAPTPNIVPREMEADHPHGTRMTAPDMMSNVNRKIPGRVVKDPENERVRR
jgi:hypothetical protein